MFLQKNPIYGQQVAWKNFFITDDALQDSKTLSSNAEALSEIKTNIAHCLPDFVIT